MCAQLKAMREEAGLTQRELAETMGEPHHSTIWKIEQGERRIDPVEFIRWCIGCGVDYAAAMEAIPVRSAKG